MQRTFSAKTLDISSIVYFIAIYWTEKHGNTYLNEGLSNKLFGARAKKNEFQTNLSVIVNHKEKYLFANIIFFTKVHKARFQPCKSF